MAPTLNPPATIPPRLAETDRDARVLRTPVVVQPVRPVASPAPDTWSALRRYLLIGGVDRVLTDPLPVTVADADPVRAALAEDSLRVVAEILAATAANPSRPEPLLLALALAAAADDDLTRRAALVALPRVARTSRDLFLFATFVQSLRGWGRGLRRAIGAWYNDRSPAALVEDILATPGFAGWRHADLLRLGHPKAPTITHDAIYRWVVTGVSPPALLTDPAVPDSAALLARLAAATAVSEMRDGVLAAALIATHRLPLAAVPASLRREPCVWQALLPHLRSAEVLTSLPELAATDSLVPGNPVHETVTDRLVRSVAGPAGGVTPLAVVAARRAYESGHSGTDRWDVRDDIMTALDRAFDLACRRVETCDLPVTMRIPAGLPGCTARNGIVSALDVAATLAIILSRSESDARIAVVGDATLPLRLAPGASLVDTVAAIGRLAARAGSRPGETTGVEIDATLLAGARRVVRFGDPGDGPGFGDRPDPAIDVVTVHGCDRNLIGTVLGLLRASA